MRIRALPAWTLLLALAGCSNIIRMQPDQRIPAAIGTIQIKATSNNNTAVDLEVHHLAEPSRVRPGATAYVVWIAGTSPNDGAQNVGALQVNRKLSGSLQTVTPFRSFSIFLTTEGSATVQSPTDQPLMVTSVMRR